MVDIALIAAILLFNALNPFLVTAGIAYAVFTVVHILLLFCIVLRSEIYMMEKNIICVYKFIKEYHIDINEIKACEYPYLTLNSDERIYIKLSEKRYNKIVSYIQSQKCENNI